jgi:hypothetical protein
MNDNDPMPTWLAVAMIVLAILIAVLLFAFGEPGPQCDKTTALPWLKCP